LDLATIDGDFYVQVKFGPKLEHEVRVPLQQNIFAKHSDWYFSSPGVATDTSGVTDLSNIPGVSMDSFLSESRRCIHRWLCCVKMVLIS